MAPSLGMTLGAVYIGATVAAILFGITNLQAVIYYKKYPDDWWVAIIWAFDALHVALGTHALYHYLIDLFGNYITLDDIVWSFKDLETFMFSLPECQDNGLISLLVGHHFHQMLPLFVVLCLVVSGGVSNNRYLVGIALFTS
ncbi:uncharacterized protein ARMOST_18796 [Armillaria ostoyae]|uniref:Uncharacterized protein n=1 Tax=Armillaria ostoyae TaxID=47428 RepID=A0A284S2Q5_ARMOS|nr:uncharacterized protein ARMOST_18796 [Armillaria ostoyae]